MGETKHITRYCGKLAPSLTCLTGNEGSTKAYDTYGLREGNMQELASFDVLKAGFRAFKQGHIGGTPTGNVKMMPGTFIVDQQGHIKFTYYSQHAGDHPAIADLLAAAQHI